MKIKKYIATTLSEGKELIKSDLGKDAIILSSRTARNPEGKLIYEIVAAVDQKKKVKEVTENKIVPQSPSTSDLSLGDKDFISTAGRIFDEINSLKSLILNVGDDVKYKYAGVLGKKYAELYKVLRKANLPDDWALKITGITSSSGLKESNEILEKARSVIADFIKISPPVHEIDKLKTISFVGPTGSGKTSTLVKIAMVSKLILKSDVLIISTDSYKVGGADQLKSYADIAGISFKVADSPLQLRSIVEKEKDRDYIFIDTMGVSWNNTDKIDEIKDYLDSVESDLTYLVLSCNNSQSSIKQAFDKFKKIRLHSLILSKFDETANLADMLIALKDIELPISYFSTGQKIPEDIEPADKYKIADSILSKDIKLD